MKIEILALIMLMSLTVSGCAAQVTGTVLDSETGKPVEGAVVLVEWSMTKGVPGLAYGETYRTAETLTDKEGKFSVPKVMNPLVNRPIMVVYKKGYVAWRNDFVFPTWEKRPNFIDNKPAIIKLERFREGYSKDQYDSFMSYGINGITLEKTPNFFKAESEVLHDALQEIEKRKGR